MKASEFLYSQSEASDFSLAGKLAPAERPRVNGVPLGFYIARTEGSFDLTGGISDALRLGTHALRAGRDEGWFAGLRAGTIRPPEVFIFDYATPSGFAVFEDARARGESVSTALQAVIASPGAIVEDAPGVGVLVLLRLQSLHAENEREAVASVGALAGQVITGEKGGGAIEPAVVLHAAGCGARSLPHFQQTRLAAHLLARGDVVAGGVRADSACCGSCALNGPCLGGSSMFPATQRIHVFGRVYVTLSRSPDGTWSAVTDLPTRYGAVRLQASTDEDTIANAVVAARDTRWGQALGAINAMVSAGELDPSSPDVAQVLGMAQGYVQAVSRSQAFAQVASQIAQAMQNPSVNGAPDAGPTMAGAVALLARAASLLTRAKAGDPGANNGIRTIGALAQAGDAMAQQSLSMLQQLSQEPGQTIVGCGPMPYEVPTGVYDRWLADYRGGPVDLVAGADGYFRAGRRRTRYGLGMPRRLPLGRHH